MGEDEVAVAVDEFVNDSGGREAVLERRRAQFRRRRIAMGMREVISLAATGLIGVWVCAVVLISLSAQ